jgi:hypothetical protein
MTATTTTRKTRKSTKATKPTKATSNGAVRYGVNAVIRELLSAASAKKPLLRATLFEALVKRFPKHNATAMKRTLNGMVSYHLPRGNKKFHGTVAKGYWLAK